MTRDNGENMDPTPEDMADTLSASYRAMRELSGDMQRILDTIWLVELAVALCAGMLAYYILHRLVSK